MGSGGGSNTTNSVSEFKPPEYTQLGGAGSTPGGTWQDYIRQGTALAQQGGPGSYQGMTVAPLTNYQNTAGTMANSLAQQGNPTTNAANTQLTATMMGMFGDPYAVTANPFMGQNPYLDSMINSSNQKITDQYAKGTAAQTDASAAMGGSFGGSAYDERVRDNQNNLAGAIGQNTNNLLKGNYDQSAGLAENMLNRASGAVQSERGRQIQAAGMAPGMSQVDINEINLLNQMGGQQQGNYKELLTAQQQDWLQQAMRQFNGNDMLGNILSRASTGQGQTTQSQMTPGSSPVMQGVGTAAALYGLLGK